MTLAEFDKIRPYLKDDGGIQIEIVTPKEVPDSDEVFAVELWDWGNHDGRFNVMCASCGDVLGMDIPLKQKAAMRAQYEHKPCPKCGRTFIKRKDIKR